MELSGSFYGKTSNSAIKPKITWWARENVEGNYSEVTAQLSYSRSDSYTTSGHWNGWLSIGSDRKTVSNKYVQISKNSNTVTVTHTVQVPHLDDGTKTVTISAAGAIPDTTLTKTTISAAVTLAEIPRSAAVFAADGDIGSSTLVLISRTGADYRYRVAYAFGNRSGYLSEAGPVSDEVFVTAASLPFPLPEEFYDVIPNSPSGPCTLTCTTYQGDQVVGEPRQCVFTVRANPQRCGPQLTCRAEDENPATLALTGNAETFVRYASRARCSLQASSRYGADIVQMQIAGQSAPEGTLVIPQISQESIRFCVTDSRGFSAEQILPVQLLPYFLPVLRVFAERVDPTSGRVRLQAQGSYYAQLCRLTLTCQVGTGESTVLEPVLENDQFSVDTVLTGLDYTQSHRITVTADDGLNRVSISATVNPGVPLFHWGREDFSFQVPVYYRGKLLEAQYLSLDGGSLTGDLSLGGNRLGDLPEPQLPGEAATKAYVDGRCSIQLLWTNPAANESFTEQDLELDLHDYQWVAIHTKFKPDNGQTKMHFCPVDCQVGLDVITISGYRGLRKADVSQTGIHFYKASYCTDTLHENVSGYVIPLAVYGIRGIGDTNERGEEE